SRSTATTRRRSSSARWNSARAPPPASSRSPARSSTSTSASSPRSASTPTCRPTVSSSSIHRGGPQLRAAAAEARQVLLQLASMHLGVQVGSLTVSKGVVAVGGDPRRSVRYGDLVGDKPFNVKLTGTAPQKPIARYSLVGTRVPRLDIPDKVA